MTAESTAIGVGEDKREWSGTTFEGRLTMYVLCRSVQTVLQQQFDLRGFINDDLMPSVKIMSFPGTQPQEHRTLLGHVVTVADTLPVTCFFFFPSLVRAQQLGDPEVFEVKRQQFFIMVKVV